LSGCPRETGWQGDIIPGTLNDEICIIRRLAFKHGTAFLQPGLCREPGPQQVRLRTPGESLDARQCQRSYSEQKQGGHHHQNARQRKAAS